MRIRHLTLPSPDPEACIAFFHDVLQVPTDDMTARLGWTDVNVVPGDAGTGVVHLAFNIPPERFGTACEWLQDRALILRNPTGEDRFRLAGSWQSRSVYFAGPHGAVFELIARDALASTGHVTGPFHGEEILCVSEVGLPADHVPTLVGDLVAGFGMAPFGEGSDVFAPVGDHEGLLILVEKSRRWFPEATQLPGAFGVRMAIEGVARQGHYADTHGWLISADA